MTEPLTVASVLRAQVGARADHPLLVCDDDIVTYRQAERLSAVLALRLVTLGAGKGTHVGLLLPNGSAFVVAAFAAARIGAVVVPFSTFSTTPELADQLRHSDVEILVSARSFRGHDYRARLAALAPGADIESRAAIVDAHLPCLRHVLFEPANERDTDPTAGVDEDFLRAVESDVDESDILAIIYTSGSTGAPKGVVHTHSAVLQHQRNLNGIRGLRAEDRLFCNSPFFWIGGFGFALVATLLAGATLVCSVAEDPGCTLDLIEREKPTVTNGFVGAIAHLVAHPSFASRDLSSLRRGNLYPVMAPEARPADPELRHNMLGLTEAGSVVLISADDTDQPETRRGSYGKPAPSYEIRVVDSDGGDVATGTVGELWLRGPYLMQHYHRRSRDESVDADGWFHTGDLVRVDVDGFVYFVGRSTGMIKTAGANVAPSEVEKAISKVTGLSACVVGLPDPDRGEVVAAVVAADAGSFNEAVVRQLLAAELSAYKIPRRFAVVDRIPVLSSGKVDMGALREALDG